MLLQRLVHPLARQLDTAQPEQGRDGTAALDLAHKVLELGAVAAAGNVRLHCDLEGHALPVGVALRRALYQHGRRQRPFDVDGPAA